MGSLRQGLVDPSAYVRKTAVMGCAKLFALVPQTIKDSDLVDVLYNMLRDKDTQVMTNALVALNEILRSEGGMAINKLIIFHLLSRIKDFSEWGQCTVIELVSKYTPENQEEMFEIMVRCCHAAMPFAQPRLRIMHVPPSGIRTLTNRMCWKIGCVTPTLPLCWRRPRCFCTTLAIWREFTCQSMSD
jgi:vesicle coat complex subunit